MQGPSMPEDPPRQPEDASHQEGAPGQEDVPGQEGTPGPSRPRLTPLRAGLLAAGVLVLLTAGSLLFAGRPPWELFGPRVDYTVYGGPDAGVQIAVPSSWETDFVEQQGTGLLVSAVSDEQDATAYMTLHRVTVEESTVQGLVDDLRGSVDTTQVEDFEAGQVTLPGGDEAAFVEYKYSLERPEGGQGLVNLYLVFDEPGEALGLRLITYEPDAYGDIFDEIGQSLRRA